MKKYAIFWIDSQREMYSDDSYHVLGTNFGIFDTYDDAEIKAKELANDRNMITILPVYTK